MAKNFNKRGDVITFTAGADLTGGQYLKVGDLPGIVANTVKNGESAELITRGVFTLAKATADTPSVGDKAYWDDGNSEVTTVSSTFDLIGVFETAAGNGDTSARVRLSGIPV